MLCVSGAPQVAGALGDGQRLLGFAQRIAKAPEDAVNARAAVSHPVKAEVDQAGPRRQVDGHQVCARSGQEDLATVAEPAR